MQRKFNIMTSGQFRTLAMFPPTPCPTFHIKWLAALGEPGVKHSSEFSTKRSDYSARKQYLKVEQTGDCQGIKNSKSTKAHHSTCQTKVGT